MKRRILSIDFDYFLDTDIDTRNDKFPDGQDDIPPNELESLWNYFYDKYPEILNIGVINDFYICCDILSHLRPDKVFIADSHKDIAELFPLIDPEDDLEVINVDFHHDNYISSGDKLDCANWVRHLKIQRPNTEIKWIKREDSDSNSLLGEFPYEQTEDLNTIEGGFDYVFLCFSPEWTPPHLRSYFRTLCTYFNRI